MWSDDDIEDAELVGSKAHPIIEKKDKKFGPEFIKDLLYSHEVERRKQEWQLYDFEEVYKLYEKIKEELQYRNRYFKDMTYMQTWWGSFPVQFSAINMFEILKEVFPLCSMFLDLMPNNVVIAGGSLTSVFKQKRDYEKRNIDVDFFFHSTTPDQIMEYLQKAIKLMGEKYAKQFVVLQNKYVTTIIHDDCVDVKSKYRYNDIVYNGTKYQFVHRCFPNLSSVIGGFDIGASMILMTGERKIYFNRLGLFTFATGTIVVDIKSASSSFGYRLQKYHSKKDFSTLIPVSIKEKVRKTLTESFEMLGIDKGFSKFSIKLGENFFIKCECYDAEHFANYGPSEKINMGESDYDCLHPNKDMSYSNFIAAVNGNWGMYYRFGETWEDLQNYDVFPPYKVFKRLVYDKKLRVAIANNYGNSMTTKASEFISASIYDKIKATFIENKEKSRMEIIGSDENPGRQFTASFHPTNPKDWYNKSVVDISKCLRFGISDEVFTLLECARRKGQGLIGMLPKDIFKYIMNWVFILEGEDARNRVCKRLDIA